MGRCGKTTKQTTLIPTSDDCFNPVERLKQEFEYEFTVHNVALIMINAKNMQDVPLAGYDIGPALAKKNQKRKDWVERVDEVNKAPISPNKRARASC